MVLKYEAEVLSKSFNNGQRYIRTSLVDVNGNQITVDGNGNIKTVIEAGDALIGRVKLSDGITVAVVDSDTKCLRVIEAEHSRIHAGVHYFANDYNASIGAGTSYTWTIHNGANMAHLTFNIVSSLNGHWELFEGPTVSNSPAALASFNNKRNLANTTDTVIRQGATLSDNGTTLLHMPIGGDGTNPQGNRGGNFDRKNEKEFKTGTIYALKYTSLTNNNRVGVLFEWYYGD